MKVLLKIAKPSKAAFVIKAKDYTEAANILASGPFAACYEANPTYPHKFNDEGQINEITIQAKPVITMPKWSGASKLKGDEKKHWEAMIKALAKHEAKHHAKWLADAKAFKKKAEAEGDFPKKEIHDRMRDFFTQAQATQTKYDSDSKNGQKEGVVLPV